MKLIDQYHEILSVTENPEQLIERAGRTCYKSEHKITEDSASKFVSMLVKTGHHSVIEHANATVKFVTNRGATHELVRHRIASYSQESTRYCNYGGSAIVFIKPVWYDAASETNKLNFNAALAYSERIYNMLLTGRWKPEEAREVLPEALKTEIIMTANFREWIHVFKLRTSKKAHPQIRALFKECQKDFIKIAPSVFGTE